MISIRLLISILIPGVLWYFSKWWYALIAWLFINLVIFRGYRTLWLLIRTFRRDMTAAKRFMKVSLFNRRALRLKKTVPMLFQDTVARHPAKIMFKTAERNWTFQEVEDYTNKVANNFAKMGLSAGDDVALLMENRAEVIFLWLGLSKIGVATAIINYNLRQSPLVHCISVVKAKMIIFSPQMTSHVVEVADELQNKMSLKFFSYGTPTEDLSKYGTVDVFSLIDKSSIDPPAFKGSLDDRLIYIYTSGTTGLPKAAVIKHMRFISCAAIMNNMLPIKNDDDTMYYYLPLYHIAGGVLGVSNSIIYGVTGAVATKFSATNFWSECIKFECTVTQYIGEICRYLYAQPPKDVDRQHSLRMMYGNGLRPQLWVDFKNRFGIKNMRELYGSTEGNANIMNIDNKVGCVGFIPTISRVSPAIARFIYNLNLIKVDEETGEPLRDKNGLCIPCKPNEGGEMVASITDRPTSRFDGYTDSSATKKKIYTNVFFKGDKAFASGDILTYDEDGYLFFKDRTGDTFRWKGENVSTAEVEGVISKHAGLSDSVVFGVEVAGSEGKAGMVVLLDPERKTDFANLLSKISKELPPYAVPVFVRLTSSLEATGTFKLPKTKLMKEGYDIAMHTDPVFFLDSTHRKYVELDSELYGKIVNRKVRV